jgi:hypothetical protein
MIVLVVLSVLMAGARIVPCTGASGEVGTPRKVFIFLQNRDFGAIPPRRKGVVT